MKKFTLIFQIFNTDVVEIWSKEKKLINFTEKK